MLSGVFVGVRVDEAITEKDDLNLDNFSNFHFG
jgi:hypothetical protein